LREDAETVSQLRPWNFYAGGSLEMIGAVGGRRVQSFRRRGIGFALGSADAVDEVTGASLRPVTVYSGRHAILGGGL
jgi:hypothetical protein